MSLTYLNYFPIETISVNIAPISFLILASVEFFLLNIFFNQGYCRISKLFSRYLSSVQSHLDSFNVSKVQPGENKNQDLELSKGQPACFGHQKIIDDGSVCREEVEMMMERLGIFCHPEDAKLQERLGSDDLFNLFEEKAPNLDDVKGAFDVFDVNGDGFIDASDLQRVLCALGLTEYGTEIENCRRMISAFDENGDGRIDFNEFVKFMEDGFC